jgi:hypothetical protein
MRMKTNATVAAAVAVAGITAGIAVASIPDGAGNIHACYKRDSGMLRIIDPGAGDACKAPSEAALQWNVIPLTGPTGSQGPQGPAGPQGQKGPQGAQGANAVTFEPQTMTVSAFAFAAQQIGGFFVTLTCPQGTKALMGGWHWFYLNGNKPPPMGESFPISDDEWGFAVEAGGQSVGWDATVTLRCAIAR